jgi:hypothetical protein
MTEVDGRKHSGDVKIVDLIGEHLQTKEKIIIGEESRKINGEEERANLFPHLLIGEHLQTKEKIIIGEESRKINGEEERANLFPHLLK